MMTAKPSEFMPSLLNMKVAVLSDHAIESIDGVVPSEYVKIEGNGVVLSRELTVEIHSTLSRLSTSLLKKLSKLLKQPNLGTRACLIEACQDYVVRNGVRIFVSRLPKRVLKKALVAFDIKAPPKQKILIEAITKIGLQGFFHEICDVNMFVEFCKVLGLEAGPSFDHQSQLSYNKTSPELERELCDEIILIGMDDTLKSLPSSILVEICQELAILHVDLEILPDSYQMADLIMDLTFNLNPIHPETQSYYSKLYNELQQANLKKRKSDDALNSGLTTPIKNYSPRNSHLITSPIQDQLNSHAYHQSGTETPNKRRKLSENAFNNDLAKSRGSTPTIQDRSPKLAKSPLLNQVVKRRKNGKEGKRPRGRPPGSTNSNKSPQPDFTYAYTYSPTYRPRSMSSSGALTRSSTINPAQQNTGASTNSNSPTMLTLTPKRRGRPPTSTNTSPIADNSPQNTLPIQSTPAK